MPDFKEFAIKVRDLASRYNDDIFRKVKNDYIIYNRFMLTHVKSKWIVTGANIQLMFVNAPTAVAWCLAECNNNKELANQIYTIEKKLQLLSVRISDQQQFLSNSKIDNFTREINIAKVTESIFNYKQLTAEMYKYIKQSKYIKLKKDLLNGHKGLNT